MSKRKKILAVTHPPPLAQLVAYGDKQWCAFCHCLHVPMPPITIPAPPPNPVCFLPAVYFPASVSTCWVRAEGTTYAPSHIVFVPTSKGHVSGIW